MLIYFNSCIVLARLNDLNPRSVVVTELLELLRIALVNARANSHNSIEVSGRFKVISRVAEVIKVIPLGDSVDNIDDNFVLLCRLLKNLDEPFTAVRGQEAWWLEITR